jgi:hypothetical protein
VRARGANLGPRGGAANVNLDIAAPAPPAVGTLPGALDGQVGVARAPGAVPSFVPPLPITAAPPAAPNRTRPVMSSRPAMNNPPPGTPGLQTQ